MKIALLILSLFLSACANYQSHVDSRSIGMRGSTDGQSAEGKVIYTVRYK